MKKPYPKVNYADYLGVDKILNLQSPKGIEYGKPAHDEMLFIIVHQVYELWFKQILWELDSALDLFSQPTIDEGHMLKMVSRFHRVIEIQKLLIQQVDVLETMTPMDFLEFRDFLFPASGFQSHQFRLVENKLGLVRRLKFNNQDYKNFLKDEEKPAVKDAEEAQHLFGYLEKWLERMPFITTDTFNFWQSYRAQVEKMFDENEQAIRQAGLDAESTQQHLDSIKSSRESFHSIFNEEEYKKMQDNGLWRLSHKALQAALFIQLYRDEPLLQAPFHLITSLQNIDENFTMWRQRHAMMAHRMLGAKMGTGGSAGHKYLAAAADKHKIFTDLFNLSTFLIPKSQLPVLPPELNKKLRFQY